MAVLGLLSLFVLLLALWVTVAAARLIQRGEDPVLPAIAIACTWLIPGLGVIIGWILVAMVHPRQAGNTPPTV